MIPSKELMSRVAKASRINVKYMDAVLNDKLTPCEFEDIKARLTAEMHELIEDGVDNLKKSESLKLRDVCMYKNLMQE
ncbi:MAG: hypothetical protein M0R51_13290 [Clostridia bacterium]|jgi:hypothetical protein|nr:hypothetical protein [Clostridia bacterium]